MSGCLRQIRNNLSKIRIRNIIRIIYFRYRYKDNIRNRLDRRFATIIYLADSH